MSRMNLNMTSLELELRIVLLLLNLSLSSLSFDMAANVCVSSVVRFRSRVLSPTPNVERRYKLWITRHRTIEETFCWALGRVNRYLVHDLSQVVRYFSLTSPSPLLAKTLGLVQFCIFQVAQYKMSRCKKGMK
jgi:hypothetical protein